MRLESNGISSGGNVWMIACACLCKKKMPKKPRKPGAVWILGEKH